MRDDGTLEIVSQYGSERKNRRRRRKWGGGGGGGEREKNRIRRKGMLD